MKRAIKKKRTMRYRPYWVRGLHLKQCRLMKFQQRIVRWMAQQRRKRDTATGQTTIEGVILNVDYGLGKTLMSLAHTSMFGWNVLFICPTGVLTHIRSEITKHFGSQMSCFEAKGWEPGEFAKHKITLMSYYVLARLDLFEMQARPYLFTTCIVDELEDAIKKDAVEKNIRTMIQARFFVGLTGANRIQDSMLTIVHTIDRRNIYEFRQCSNFVLKTEFLSLSEGCKSEYNKIKEEVASKTGLAAHRLLQAARTLISQDKVNYVLCWLARLRAFKVLVVSEFCSTLQHIANELKNHKQNHILFDAKHIKTQEKRDYVIRVFENPTSKFNFMLADCNLIGFGLDFGFVDAMIVVDLPRELLFYRQLQGRLRRIGQHPKQVEIQHVIEIVAKDTCDFTLYSDIHSTTKHKI